MQKTDGSRSISSRRASLRAAAYVSVLAAVASMSAATAGLSMDVGPGLGDVGLGRGGGGLDRGREPARLLGDDVIRGPIGERAGGDEAETERRDGVSLAPAGVLVLVPVFLR